ncbi:DUF3238 domain-containing protein [Paenibacillus alvei]|uniref:DUF3238 domain-containing protein n=1 Tax=Paenibacillus alvei TaxID=44250 RepID=UPI0018CD42C0|nr:DUF3238 domain-containing protein [Paenibacillus alvei]MBG9737168.1 permease [Paenibacillus alvei]MBG9746262.1 permease [Paenibacillus alvei]MCY9581602.1 DUF3238 domain-containing protein [Paenibacillus alvei]MCY9586270.1 DUF3238 domain-containing protein [Paenibacillus alvei]
MANIVKIRANVFIPMSWTEPKQELESGNIVQYEGDTREFTPYAVNAMRSRVEQEVVVDLYKKEVFSYSNTGITTEKVTLPDDSVHKRTGKASTEGILCTHIRWGSNEVMFQMRASASNPLQVHAPSVDYLLHVRVTDDGRVEVDGRHDGFPCFEFYKQVDFGAFEQMYIHDFRETGDTVQALAGEMEYHFKKVL